MAISVDDIVPAGSAPAPETPTAGAPAKESESTIPEPVLAIPAMRALLQGTPPAVSAPVGDQSPEAQAIAASAKPLMEAGFGFYRSKDGTKDVLFNITQIEPAAIKLADQKGELDTIAPPLSELNATLTGGSKAESTSEAPAASAPPPSSVPATPTPKPLTRARIANATLGGPTDGAAPGQGRILSNILKTSV